MSYRLEGSVIHIFINNIVIIDIRCYKIGVARWYVLDYKKDTPAAAHGLHLETMQYENGVSFFVGGYTT
jgi:hypothetical protein